MRVVGFESDVVHPHRVEGVQTVAVAEEATEDLAVVVGGGRFGNDVGHSAPGTVLAPHIVDPFQKVRQPEIGERGHGIVETQRGSHRRRGIG